MMPYLSAGVLLGLTAGFSPGPLFALVLSQTLAHGIREGAKVALSPLVTDLPIILVSLFVVKQLEGIQPLLGVISLAGGLYVAFMALECFRTMALASAPGTVAPRSLLRGAFTNILSPHPYLFWITVGGPTMMKGWAVSPVAAAGFAAGFFVSLIGAKIILAVMAGKSRRFLTGGGYGLVMRLLGSLLLILALILFRDGATLLSLIPS